MSNLTVRARRFLAKLRKALFRRNISNARIVVSAVAAAAHTTTAVVLVKRRRPVVGLALLLIGAGQALTMVDFRNLLRLLAIRVGLRGGSVNATTAPDRFRRIYPAQPRAAAKGMHGRQAAAVQEDEQRPYNLFSATLGMGDLSPDVAELTKRAIAFVGTPDLAAALSPDFNVVALRPGMSTAQLEFWRPTAIVIQRSALLEGQWGGALRAPGASLMHELQQVCEWGHANATASFLIPDGDGNYLADGALSRSISIDLGSGSVEEAASEWGGETPALTALLNSWRAGR